MYSIQVMFILLLAFGAKAADKSSTQPGLVKLPTAAGTVASENGSFNIDRARGSASLKFDLPELPNRNIQSDLGLIYGQYNGDAGSGFGIGWSLGVGSIELNHKQGGVIFGFDDAGQFLNGLSFNGQKLLPVETAADGQTLSYLMEAYNTDVEIEHFKSPREVEILGSLGELETVTLPAGFEVRYPNGYKEYYTGDLSQAEGNEAYGLVTRWPLVLRVNPGKDAVRYFYEKHNGRSYLREVSFGGGSRYILHLMNTRETVSSFINSHPQRNTVLYSHIDATFDGTLHSRWCFAYVGRDLDDGTTEVIRAGEPCAARAQSDLSADLDNRRLNVLDRLEKIYRFGNSERLEQGTLEFSSVEFDYSTWRQTGEEREYVYPISDAATWVGDVEQAFLELTDINNDALVDIVYREPFSTSTTAFLGTADPASSFSEEVTWRVKDYLGNLRPAPLLHKNESQFADLDGDGYPDLVQIGDNRLTFYMGQSNGQLRQSSTAFTFGRGFSISAGNFGEGGYRFQDINGDGRSDILGYLHGYWIVYLNETEKDASGKINPKFTAHYRYLPKDFGLDSSTILHQPNVKLMDMNSDGLTDLVEFVSSGFCLFENQGDFFYNGMLFGDYNSYDSICEHGKYVELEGTHTGMVEGVWLIDVNADGIPDVVSIGERRDQLNLWLGFGNGQFVHRPETIELGHNLQLTQAGSTEPGRSRVADIDGDGHQELIVLKNFAAGSSPVVVVDFNRIASDKQRVKSGLLTTARFDSGQEHHIRYSTSINEIQRDLLSGEEGLAKSIHFPVTVVKQLVTIDPTMSDSLGLRPQVQYTEFLYHLPYYYAPEKQFLGFGEVESVVYGDEHRNSAATQSSFYTRELFYTDETEVGRHLAGQTRYKETRRYAPADSYAIEQRQIALIDSAGYLEHSRLEYSRTQDLPYPGLLLSTEENDITLTPHPRNRNAWFTRNIVSSSTLFAGLESDEAGVTSQTAFSDFDEYNIPHIKESSLSGQDSPSGVKLPGRGSRDTYYFDESRPMLAGLGIRTAPNRVVSEAKQGSESLQVVSDVSYEYETSFGKVVRQTGHAFSSLDHDQLPPELRSYHEPVKTINRFFEIDDLGNPISASDELGITDVARYDARGLFPISSTNALGHQSRIFYSGQDLTGVPFPTGYQMPAQAGLPIAVQTPAGSFGFIEYDSLGRKTRHLSSTGQEKRFIYRQPKAGKPGMLRTIVRRHFGEDADLGPEWIETLQAFTSMGMEIAQMETAEQPGLIRVSSWKSHNQLGKPTFVHTPFTTDGTIDGIFSAGDLPLHPRALDDDPLTTPGTAYRYDGLGRIEWTRTSAGMTTEVEYYQWGTLAHNTFDNGMGGTTNTIVEEIRDGNTVYGVKDEEGHLHRFNRDYKGHLSSILLAGETNPRLVGHDSHGRMEYQKVPGVGEWYYFHDVRGRTQWVVRYDSQGRLLHQVEHLYDDLNRKIAVYVDGDLVQEYGYDAWPEDTEALGSFGDPVGLPTYAFQADPNGIADVESYWGYDAMENMVESRIQIGESDTFTENFEYTLDGVVKRKTDAYGVVSEFRLAPSMRLQGVSMYLPWEPGVEQTIIENVEYNPEGKPEFFLYRHGATTRIVYDEISQFMRQIISDTGATDSNAGALQNLEMIFDGRGSIVQIRDFLGKDAAALERGHINREGTFSYNLRNELIQATRYDENHAYSYSPSGALLNNSEFAEATLNPVTGEGENLTTLVPAGTPENQRVFDSAGHLVEGGRVADTQFDAFGRLIRATTTEGKTVSFGYDHTGRRVYKRIVDASDTQEKNVFFPTPSTTEEGTGRQSFVFVSGDYRAARVDHGIQKWYYYLKDHLTSSDIMMSSDGYPVEQMLYRSYGTEIDPEIMNPDWASYLESLPAGELQLEKTHHRFTGHYLDDDTGLYYMKARYYDPKLGRFISPDPLFLSQPEKCVSSPIECNLFSYAGNNPMTYIDPTGTEIFAWPTAARGGQILVNSITLYADDIIRTANRVWNNSVINDNMDTVLRNVLSGTHFNGKDNATTNWRRINDTQSVRYHVKSYIIDPIDNNVQHNLQLQDNTTDQINAQHQENETSTETDSTGVSIPLSPNGPTIEHQNGTQRGRTVDDGDSSGIGSGGQRSSTHQANEYGARVMVVVTREVRTEHQESIFSDGNPTYSRHHIAVIIDEPTTFLQINQTNPVESEPGLPPVGNRQEPVWVEQFSGPPGSGN